MGCSSMSFFLGGGKVLEMMEDFGYHNLAYHSCSWGLHRFYLLSVYQTVPHKKNGPFPNSFNTHIRNTKRNADIGGPLYTPKGSSMFPDAPLNLGQPAFTTSERSTFRID